MRGRRRLGRPGDCGGGSAPAQAARSDESPTQGSTYLGAFSTVPKLVDQ